MTDPLDPKKLLKAIDHLTAAPEISYLNDRPKLRRWLATVIYAAKAYAIIHQHQSPAWAHSWAERYLHAVSCPSSRPAPGDALNAEMAQVLQDIVTLCEQGEFEPAIFLDFIRDGKTRNLMQYHRDYFHKLTSKQ